MYVLNNFDGFAITEAGDTLSSNIKTDLLIQKLNSNGEQEWIRKYGNDKSLRSAALALDKDMNVYCEASFSGSLNVDPGNSDLVINSTASSYDVFIQKLTSNGSMVWTKRFGGAGTEFGEDMTIAPDGHIYSIGNFVGELDFIPSSMDDNLYASTYNDGFFAKFDLDGQFVYSFSFGSNRDDYGERIHCDSSNNVIVHGRYEGELAINTDEGDRIVFSNGNHFLLKFGEPNINTENNLYIGLSPNPVENIVSVDQLDASEFAQLESTIEIKIFDDLGRFIFKTVSNSVHTEIDLSNYRIGVYLIQVKRGNKYFLEKVVKTGKQL